MLKRIIAGAMLLVLGLAMAVPASAGVQTALVLQVNGEPGPVTVPADSAPELTVSNLTPNVAFTLYVYFDGVCSGETTPQEPVLTSETTYTFTLGTLTPGDTYIYEVWQGERPSNCVTINVEPDATEEPTEVPTEAPTEIPTEVPTEQPTEAPTEVPGTTTPAPTEDPGATATEVVVSELPTTGANHSGPGSPLFAGFLLLGGLAMLATAAVVRRGKV